MPNRPKWLICILRARWRAKPPKSRLLPNACWREPICSLRSLSVSNRSSRGRCVLLPREFGPCGVYLRYLFETRLGMLGSASAPSVMTAYERPPDMRGRPVHRYFAVGSESAIWSLPREWRANVGALTLAIVNDDHSPAAAAAELVLPIGAGREYAVAATKTVVSSMIAGARLWQGWRATTT